MRNLKKVLALVLALMMALSLMVTASASDYADDSDISKDVAVDVMSALEVFNGTDGGNFDPTGTLTRGQAAKIIAYLQLGKVAADEYLPELANQQVFDDVKPGRWYSGAVNYCYGLGIVSGRSEKVFDPTGDVTGIEFAKMLLGALGYNADIEGYTGTSLWSLNIKRQGDAIKMNTNVSYTSAKLTREEACQMAFNILTAAMVQYDKDGNRSDIKDNNVTRTLAGSVFGLQEVTGDVTAVGTTSSVKPEGTAVDFAGNLGIEYLGHNVTVYYRTDDGKNVADTVVDNSVVVKLTGDETANKAALKEALGKEPDATYASVPVYDSETGAVSSSNGGTTTVTVASGTDIVIITDKAITATVTAVTYKLDKVVEIKDDTYKSKEKTTAVAKDAWVGYDGIAKDDVVVTYTVAEILYVEPAETVVGKVTAADGSTFTVNGKEYKVEGTVTEGVVDAISDLTTVGFTAEYTLYLNPNGTAFAIVGEASAPSDSVLAYVVAHYTVAGEADAYGDGAAKNFLQCVTTDGEIVDYETAIPYDGGQNNNENLDGKLVKLTADTDPEHKDCYTAAAVAAADAMGSGDQGALVAGDVGFEKIENNAAANQAAGADKVLDGTKVSIKVTEGGQDNSDTVATNYYDDAVKFVYVTGSKSTLKVEVMDGRQTVTIRGEAADSQAAASAKVLYIVEAADATNCLVKTVFVLQAYEAPEEYSDDVIFAAEGDGSVTAKAPYVDASGETQTGYKHTVYINGEKKEITTDSNAKLNGFFKYSMDGGAHKLTATTAEHLKTAAAITGAFNGMITTNAVTDLPVKGATVVNLTTNDTVPTDPTKLTTDHTVALVLNESKDAVVIVYVTAVDTPAAPENPGDNGDNNDEGGFTAGTPTSNVALTATTDASGVDWTDTTSQDNTSALNGKKVTLKTADGNTTIGEVTFVTTEPSGNTEVKVEATTSLSAALAAAQTALQAQATAAATTAAQGTTTYTAYTDITLTGAANSAITAACTTTVNTYAAS